MENIVIKIEADTSGVQSTIEMLKKMGVVSDQVFDAYTKNVEQNSQAIKKSVDISSKSFEQLNNSIKSIKADNNLAKSLDASQAIVQTGNSLASLRSQLKEATDQAQKFADKYGELDARTIKAARSASELRQKIEDTSRVIKALDPGEKFNTIKNFASSIGGLFQVATGSLQAFGVESEKAQKIAQQFQGALNIFQGLQGLSDLKDNFIALQAALVGSTAATEAQTVAMVAETGAAEAGAVANEAFSASLSATGIGAIVVLLGSLAFAFSEITSNADDTTLATKRLKEETERLAKIKKELKDIAKDEYESEVDLEVVRGHITEQEGERRKLQARSKEEYTKNSRDIYLADQERQKSLAKLQKAQEDLNAAEKYTGQGAAEARKAAQDRVDIFKKAADKQQEVYDNLIAKRENTDALYRTKFQANQEKEQKDQKEAAEGKTAFEIAVDRVKGDYEKLRAEESKAFGTLYTDTELFGERVAVLKKKETKDLIEVYKKFNKDATDLIKDVNKTEEDGLKPVEKTVNANLLWDSKTDEDQFEYMINPNLVPKPKTVVINTKVLSPEEQAIEDEKKRLKSALQDEVIAGAEEVAKKYTAVWADAQLAIDQNRLEAIDQEQKDLEEQYNRKLIGRIEYDAKEQVLNNKKKEAEKKLKHDQDLADRSKALYSVAIDTAAAIAKEFAKFGSGAIATLPLLIGIGAAQAAAIMAAPLPKYKKGTLSVPGIGSEDTQLAMLTPGEAVIPKDTNHRYKESISAIYHGKISPNDLNSFVRMKLKGDYTSSSTGPVTAKMDTSDLYALGKIIKRNDGVYIKNVGELASIFASMHNPRR